MFKDSYHQDNEKITPDESLLKYLAHQMHEIEEGRAQNDAEPPADNVTPLKPPKRFKQPWVRAAVAVAACLAIVLTAGGVYYHGLNTALPVNESPSSTTTPTTTVATGGVKTNVTYAEIYAIIKAMENKYSGEYGYAVDDAVAGNGAPTRAAQENAQTTTVQKGATTGKAATNATKATSQGAAGDKNDDYSQTNTQVKNVDEADIVKTDGKYIYRLNSSNQLAIVKADKGQLTMVSKIDCTAYTGTEYKPYPSEFYVYGDTLVIVQSMQSMQGTARQSGKPTNGTYIAYDMVYGYNNSTCVSVYDIADRAHPKLVAAPGQSGGYLSSRMVDNVLYLITNYYLYGEADEKDPATFVPVLIDGDIRTPMLPQNVVISAQPQGRQYLVVTALDVRSPKTRLSAQTVLGCGSTMYAGTENLLIASVGNDVKEEIAAGGGQTVKTTAGVPQTTIAKEPAAESSGGYTPGVDAVDPAPAFAPAAPDEKVAVPTTVTKPAAGSGSGNSSNSGSGTATTVTYTTVTRLIRFSLNKGAIKLEATGKVPGSLLNQFSMDEYDSTYRLVTTQDGYSQTVVGSGKDATVSWGQTAETSNALYTLSMNLTVLGRIENVAKGERVYSVRFDGTIGYFVTFRQTDPLFAVDLTDPKNPKILSALKIPGFSEYLHPYSDGLLFGFGKSASDTGRVTGLKLSMFDVSDPANVTEKQMLELPYGWSEASYNHKAILVSPDRGLIAFAANNQYVIYTYSADKGFAKAAEVTFGDYAYDMRGLYIGSVFYVTSYNRIAAYAMSDYHQISQLAI